MVYSILERFFVSGWLFWLICVRVWWVFLFLWIALLLLLLFLWGILLLFSGGFGVFFMVLVLQYLNFPSALCLQECQAYLKSKEALVIYETSDKVVNSYTPYHHEQVNGLLLKSRAI